MIGLQFSVGDDAAHLVCRHNVHQSVAVDLDLDGRAGMPLQLEPAIGQREHLRRQRQVVGDREEHVDGAFDCLNGGRQRVDGERQDVAIVRVHRHRFDERGRDLGECPRQRLVQVSHTPIGRRGIEVVALGEVPSDFVEDLW